jgi:hypothetical protein
MEAVNTKVNGLEISNELIELLKEMKELQEPKDYVESIEELNDFLITSLAQVDLDDHKKIIEQTQLIISMNLIRKRFMKLESILNVLHIDNN